MYVWYIDYDKTICVTNNNANGDVDHQRVALKSVLAAKGYYADFTYVNKNGTSSVPGVYNIVLDGDDRACFTTSQEISLTACPEESSSSVASSSSEVNSSDTEVESSSSEESSSSQDDAESSSSEMLEPGLSSTVTGIVSIVAAPQVQFSLEGRQLHVQTDVAGLKELRLFDLQGHLLHSEKFSGNSTSLEIGKFSRGKYIVRLSVGDKLVAVKRI